MGNSRQPAIDLNRQPEAIVRANQNEYDDLSVFQRPIVKRMFPQGTGLKVEEWIASAEQLTYRLHARTPLDAVTRNTSCTQLKRMTDFITKQESDVRGWFKDSQQLQIALAALSQHKDIVAQLIAALTELR